MRRYHLRLFPSSGVHVTTINGSAYDISPLVIAISARLVNRYIIIDIIYGIDGEFTKCHAIDTS